MPDFFPPVNHAWTPSPSDNVQGLKVALARASNLNNPDLSDDQLAKRAHDVHTGGWACIVMPEGVRCCVHRPLQYYVDLGFDLASRLCNIGKEHFLEEDNGLRDVVSSGSASVVQSLKECELEASPRFHDGDTCLHVAIKMAMHPQFKHFHEDSKVLVLDLVKLGAPLDAADGAGKTAAELAVELGVLLQSDERPSQRAQDAQICIRSERSRAAHELESGPHVEEVD
mmetsp:Transcript_130758/g.237841  ORF Transcript_130758/g.237841 Transcript_130758/m.237841 type:complete len:227 (-) Transcript_130758:293-973(-)